MRSLLKYSFTFHRCVAGSHLSKRFFDFFWRSSQDNYLQMEFRSRKKLNKVLHWKLIQICQFEQWANRHLNYYTPENCVFGENCAGRNNVVNYWRAFMTRQKEEFYWMTYLRDMIWLNFVTRLGVIFQDYQRYQMTFRKNCGRKYFRKRKQNLIATLQTKSRRSLIQKLPAHYDQHWEKD